MNMWKKSTAKKYRSILPQFIVLLPTQLYGTDFMSVYQTSKRNKFSVSQKALNITMFMHLKGENTSNVNEQ